MAEQKGTVFLCVKYLLIILWIFQIIGTVILIIGGSLVVAASHVQTDMEDKELDHQQRKVARIFGYGLIVGAIIILPISIIAIYGIYKEIYKINFWITFLSAIGFIFGLLSGVSVHVIVIQLIGILIQVYFTIKVKQSDNYSNEQNNAELGKIKPNENTAIIMTTCQQ